MQDFEPSQLTTILHGIPHLTFGFAYIENPQFTFDDNEYFESLAMVALMPIALLILSMVIFLFYYCCVGVKRAAPRKNNSSSCYCSVCVIIIFIMIAFGSCTVGMYGNIQADDGITKASQATVEINNSFSNVTQQVYDITKSIQDSVQEAETLYETNRNDPQVMEIQELVEKLDSLNRKFPEQTKGADDRLEWLVHLLDQVELYRLITTFSLIGFQCLICITGLAGVCFRSKCLLMTTTCMGLLCLSISYMFMGADLMVDVGLGDFCMDPKTWMKDTAVEKRYIDEKTANFYMSCDAKANQQFESEFDECMKTITELEQALRKYNATDTKGKELRDKMLQDVATLNQQVRNLKTSLDCHAVNQAIDKFIPAICEYSLEGLFIIAVSVLCTCLALSAVICAAPRTWKRYSKYIPSENSDLDLDEVFMPASSRSALSRTNNPLFVPPDDRFSTGPRAPLDSTRSINDVNNHPNAGTLSFFRQSEENVNLLDQPPPYSPNKFRREDSNFV